MVVTQKVQALSQPSCTLTKARVRPRLPGSAPRSMGSLSNSSIRWPVICDTSRVFSLLSTTRRTPGERSNFAGRDLRVAARDRRLALWVGAMKVSDELATGFAGFLSNGASIQYKMIGRFRRGDNLVPLRAELPRHRIDLALVESAADHSQVYFHKRASFSSIVTGLYTIILSKRTTTPPPPEAVDWAMSPSRPAASAAAR